jgi:hypothetical protein
MPRRSAQPRQSFERYHKRERDEANMDSDVAGPLDASGGRVHRPCAGANGGAGDGRAVQAASAGRPGKIASAAE